VSSNFQQFLGLHWFRSNTNRDTTHARDDGWPFQHPSKYHAKNMIAAVTGFAKNAWASVKAAFALPAPAQLAFA